MALLIPFKFLQFLDSTSCAMHNRISGETSEQLSEQLASGMRLQTEFFTQMTTERLQIKELQT